MFVQKHKAAPYTVDEHDAGLAAMDIYFAGVGANKDAWEQDKANKAYNRGSKNTRMANTTTGTFEKGKGQV